MGISILEKIKYKLLELPLWKSILNQKHYNIIGLIIEIIHQWRTWKIQEWTRKSTQSPGVSFREHGYDLSIRRIGSILSATKDAGGPLLTSARTRNASSSWTYMQENIHTHEKTKLFFLQKKKRCKWGYSQHISLKLPYLVSA